MSELVGTNEGHEYQHNTTKNRIYVIRGNSKLEILFDQTTYVHVFWTIRCTEEKEKYYTLLERLFEFCTNT